MIENRTLPYGGPRRKISGSSTPCQCRSSARDAKHGVLMKMMMTISSLPPKRETIREYWKRLFPRNEYRAFVLKSLFSHLRWFPRNAYTAWVLKRLFPRMRYDAWVLNKERQVPKHDRFSKWWTQSRKTKTQNPQTQNRINKNNPETTNISSRSLECPGILVIEFRIVARHRTTIFIHNFRDVFD